VTIFQQVFVTCVASVPVQIFETDRMNSNSYRFVNIVWSIKGYHHFQIRPHPDIPMKVEKEDGNRFDPSAMKIMMPNIQDIPVHLCDAVTRDVSRRHPNRQTVREIAGK